ncbi:MAG TPA: hypothetical protein PKO15_03125 [Fibrobacteria bacterium]|nr:hypothetical protein [Fibrobacteria bacterium]HOX50536.1 hypothetical protein [Fibrobacteria bacterium]
MKIVLVCDDSSISDHFRQAVGGQGHQVAALRGDYPLENSGLPECDAVVVEEKTWTRHVSLYRYFEVLPEFNGVAFGVIGRRKPVRIKLRRRSADAWLSTGFSPAEALEAVAALGRAAAG